MAYSGISDIIKGRTAKKAPAYEWQEMALRVINELKIPDFKRNSVFMVCKKYPKSVIERSLNDTKELCHTGEKWKYFFKVIESARTP